jgi:hypothetical protein
MIPWYAPTDFSAWTRRLMPPRVVVLALVVAALAATEMRFDWAEKIVGAYLVSTNPHRPQSGAIWEQGHKTDSARQTLAKFATQRQTVQREAQQAGTLGQVISSMVDEKGTIVSADHFLAVYLKLPPMLAAEIVSPFELLAHSNQGAWQRTFLEKQDDRLQIYLLDAHNQVIHRLHIGPELIGYIERGEVAISSSLDQLSDFNDNIYSAERFFSTLNTLPESARKKIIAHPEDLLRVTGRIRRVGLSSLGFGDAVDLGFEIDAPDGLKVVLMQGSRDEVRRLQYFLNRGSSVNRPWAEERFKQ